MVVSKTSKMRTDLGASSGQLLSSPDNIPLDAVVRPEIDPVVAYLSKVPLQHPYTSIDVSPCQRYAVSAYKDSIQVLKIAPTGLRLLRVVHCTPYLQQQRQSSSAAKKKMKKKMGKLYEDNLNLRDFALGGSQKQQPLSSSTAINVTDVAWSSFGDGDSTSTRTDSVAVAGSNGTIVVFRASTLLEAIMNASKDRSSKQQQQQQVGIQPDVVLSQQHVRSIRRLAWHPARNCTLLSSSQDGTVKLWKRVGDTTTKDSEESQGISSLFGNIMASQGTINLQLPLSEWSCPATFAPKNEAILDVSWSPFFQDVFAVVTSSGLLVLYNCIVPGRALVKIAAHSGDATTCDWHPHHESILATGGSSDRSVKVWNVESYLSLSGGGGKDDTYLTMNSNTVTSNGSGSGNEASNQFTYNLRQNKTGQKNLLHMLSISASVTMLRWRPLSRPGFVDNSLFGSQLAVSTAAVKGATASGAGMVALWSLNQPFLPMSIVEGHMEGAVTGFVWLDTPKNQAAASKRIQPNHHRLTDVASQDATEVVESDKGPMDSFRRSNKTSSPGDNWEQAWQHVLSVGRDGRCLVQSLVRGQLPIADIPSSIISVSTLPPVHLGTGSLQLLSFNQCIPVSRAESLYYAGLRLDVGVKSSGIYKEGVLDVDSGITGTEDNYSKYEIPSHNICRHVVDYTGDNAAGNRPDTNIVLSPELVHTSRFAMQYRLHVCDQFTTKAALAAHNAKVANDLDCIFLREIWDTIANLLADTVIEADIFGNESLGSSLQFALLPTVVAILEDLGNVGDVQTCVAICEVFGMVTKHQKVITEDLELSMIREWYIVYIDLLRDMSLHSHATTLIKYCRDPYISALNQQSTTFHESCPHCGKIVESTRLEPNSPSSARRYCNGCRKRIGLCFLCHEPVQGVYIWCPVCGHGGHLDHALQWFGTNSTDTWKACPTGCGHKCNLAEQLRCTIPGPNASLNTRKKFTSSQLG